MFRSFILALALVFAAVTTAQAASNVAIAPLMQVADKSSLHDAKTKYLDSKFGKDKEAKILEVSACDETTKNILDHSFPSPLSTEKSYLLATRRMTVQSLGNISGRINIRKTVKICSKKSLDKKEMVL